LGLLAACLATGFAAGFLTGASAAWAAMENVKVSSAAKAKRLNMEGTLLNCLRVKRSLPCGVI